jgi:hypothetical protein
MRMAIDRLLGRGRDMYMAFWDLKVAFDTVHRKHLGNVLKEREISDTLLRKIWCQYKNIKRIGGSKLEEFEI